VEELTEDAARPKMRGYTEMANTKKGKRRGGWGGRTIPPPDPWWKKLWGFPAKLVTAIVCILGAITAFEQVQPSLVLEPQPHPSDIQKTELVLKNDGPFALEDVEVDLQFLWLELPNAVIQAFTPEEVFIGEKVPAAESIQPKDYMQIPLPLLTQDPDLMGEKDPRSSFDKWLKIGVCIHVSFRSFPYLSWDVLPYHKVTRHYGLMAVRGTTITFSQKRSCSYVTYWGKEQAGLAGFKDKVMIRGSRYLHRHQRQGEQP
jgi:hypothetical protein